MRDQELDCFCFSLTFPSQLIDQVLITRQVVFKDGNREQMDCNHRASIGPERVLTTTFTPPAKSYKAMRAVEMIDLDI